MAETLRIILLLALAAAALTTAVLALAWWMEPGRRLARALLKSVTDTLTAPQGIGTAASQAA